MIVYSTFLSLPFGEVRWGFLLPPPGGLRGASQTSRGGDL